MNFSLCVNMSDFCSDSHNLNCKMQAHAQVCEENKLELEEKGQRLLK